MEINNKERFYKYLFITVFCGIVFFVLTGVLTQYYEHQEIKRYKKETVGNIIDFQHVNLTRYYIKYEYQVDDVIHIGRTGVEKFECDDGKLGWMGHSFRVKYSSKNPSKSIIDLEKYEKYQRTVKF